jgi:hypothetical protein
MSPPALVLLVLELSMEIVKVPAELTQESDTSPPQLSPMRPPLFRARLVTSPVASTEDAETVAPGVGFVPLVPIKPPTDPLPLMETAPCRWTFSTNPPSTRPAKAPVLPFSGSSRIASTRRMFSSVAFCAVEKNPSPVVLCRVIARPPDWQVIAMSRCRCRLQDVDSL